MIYLLDTNIWLERLLDQDRSNEVGELLDLISSDRLVISDFSLHSIGVIMTRLNRSKEFISFVQDILIDGSVGLLSLKPSEMVRLESAMDEFNLDFDDAYQYALAEIYSIEIISFDKDFDRTKRGKRSPADIIAKK